MVHSVFVCDAAKKAIRFECAGIGRDHFHGPSVSQASDTTKGARMVLVHVGYLVLPVFGSVRNRGKVIYLFYPFLSLLVPIYIYM